MPQFRREPGAGVFQPSLAPFTSYSIRPLTSPGTDFSSLMFDWLYLMSFMVLLSKFGGQFRMIFPDELQHGIADVVA